MCFFFFGAEFVWLSFGSCFARLILGGGDRVSTVAFDWSARRGQRMAFLFFSFFFFSFFFSEAFLFIVLSSRSRPTGSGA